jgi:hypothetical protein
MCAECCVRVCLWHHLGVWVSQALQAHGDQALHLVPHHTRTPLSNLGQADEGRMALAPVSIRQPAGQQQTCFRGGRAAAAAAQQGS